MAVRVGNHQLIGDGADDDRANQYHMNIMEVGTQLPGVFRLADSMAAGFAAGIEIDPPHRQAAEKRHQ
ncbi:hypothetical protein D3C72_2551440 [compost metagenome]